ncbi:MAG: 50S ribosomal protein L22 [Thermofilaceae archaeon]
MPRWSFSVQLDPARTAIAAGRDLRISYKDAVEVLDAIRGLSLERAKRFLEDVISMRRPVPYRRFKKKVGHKTGMAAGRYPVKAARAILRVLKDAEANAAYKGLDTEKLWVVHAAAHKGTKIRAYMPRAYGRATPWFEQLVHVEIGLEERS